MNNKAKKNYHPKMADAIRKVCGLPEGLSRAKMTPDQRKKYDEVSNVFRGCAYMTRSRGPHTDGYGCYKTGNGIKTVVDFIMNANA